VDAAALDDFKAHAGEIDDVASRMT